MAQFTLRDYQDLAVRLTLQRLGEGARRLYILLPTGTGKSIILVSLATHALQTGRALVLVHLQDIALQLAATFHQIGIEAGLLMQGYRQIDRPVVIATPHSFLPACSDVLAASDRPLQAVFIDEAHHATIGSAYQRILTTLEAAYGDEQISVIGFTATPYRNDEKSMHALLPTCSFVRTIPEMVEHGVLAPLTWAPLTIDLDLPVLPATPQQHDTHDYDEQALQRQLVRDALTAAIVQQVIPVIQARPTLLFALSVAHAQQFAAHFAQSDVPAAVVSSHTSQQQRQRIYADWRAGRIQVVCNCALLTEGFDFPAIAALVIARPTRSLTFYVQMLGRGTRPAPGKQDCLVIDLVGNRPETSQQILLPRVVDTHLSEEVNPVPTDSTRPTSSRHTTHPSETLLRKLHGAEKQTGLSLLDPIAQSPYAWAPFEQSYFSQLTSETTIIVERDPTGSGLYRSRLLTQERGQKPVHQWIDEPIFPFSSNLRVCMRRQLPPMRHRLRAKMHPGARNLQAKNSLQHSNVTLTRSHNKRVRSNGTEVASLTSSNNRGSDQPFCILPRER